MRFGGTWGDIGQSAEQGCLVSRLQMIWGDGNWEEGKGDGKLGGGGGGWESERRRGKRQVSAEKGHLCTTARFHNGRRKSQEPANGVEVSRVSSLRRVHALSLSKVNREILLGVQHPAGLLLNIVESKMFPFSCSLPKAINYSKNGTITK